jgi:hypothetical protein
MGHAFQYKRFKQASGKHDRVGKEMREVDRKTKNRSCLFSLKLVFVIFGRSSRFRRWTPVTTRMNGFGN